MTNILIDDNDRLLLFGYGLFETLKITSSGIELPKSHWERMYQGGRTLQLKVPTYLEWLEQIDHYISRQTSEYPYALRVTLSGGSRVQGIQPQLLFNTREIPYTSRDYDQGFSVVLLPTPRSEKSILTRIKSTNYIENILAREEAFQAQAQEGIWINSQGFISEGTMSNIFFLRGEVLHTPSLDCGCLAGTRRAVVLELASDIGVSVREGYYYPSELKEAEQIFLTNSLLGIMPISGIDGEPKDINGNVIKLLMTEYQNYVEKHAYRFHGL